MGKDANTMYLSYQAMVSQVNQGMASLEQVCGELDLKEHAATLKTTRDRMKSQVFSVGIMGEFRRGKSTVINALLRKEIVPSDIVPTSATLNYIRWDTRPRAEIHFKDGASKEIGIDELSAYVTKITKESEQMAATVEDAVVHYPCEFCQNGVQIVDTPGLNDDERMSTISEKVIPTLDAIIMVLVPDSPFSMTEAEFVRSKVMTSDLGRIIFVLNKIDTIDEEDRPRLIDSIRGKIQDSVMEKMASLYGKDSEEYQDAESKIGGIRIYGVSARNALRGHLKGDAQKVAESGMPQFEEALSHLLTVERGMLGLMGPVNSVMSIAKEARKSIGIRRDALAMDQAELKKITDEAEEAIETSRAQKMAEVSSLKNKASTLYMNMLPAVAEAYQNLERNVNEYVDRVPLRADELETDAGLDNKGKELAAELEAEIRQCYADETEKLLVRIREQVGQDISGLQQTSEEITARLENIQDKLTPKKSDTMFDWGVAAVDAVIPVVGVGGFISGWKQNGLPGALVGGGAGLLAGGAAYYGTLLFCGSVLGLATVAALPVFLIAGVASTFGGKAAVQALFKKSKGEKNMAKLRNALSSSVEKAVTTLKVQRALEQWLSETTSQVYNSVAGEIDKEIESTLMGFANTLNQLNLDRQKKESDIAGVLAKMDQLDQQLNDIAANIKPVKTKLAEALGL